MSSRSLAAARAKRAGEKVTPVSGNRPITSIGGQAAFQPGYPPNNSRLLSGKTQQHQQQLQQQPQQQQLPFSKINVSDAIGLITLRLGRVEQWIIETDNQTDESSNNQEICDNSKIVDNSVFYSLINRLEAIEKKDSTTELPNEDIKQLTQQLLKITDESNKHTLAIYKHTEQLLKFERELTETKDILKTFMMKYDLFTEETNNKFTDFEYVISELEKNKETDTIIDDTINTIYTDL